MLYVFRNHSEVVSHDGDGSLTGSVVVLVGVTPLGTSNQPGGSVSQPIIGYVRKNNIYCI